ncbi:MAG: MFS transporter [Alphaproteobacteria bacterium]|nr:MFS transporter [Alphaproteobacteria bacterium]
MSQTLQAPRLGYRFSAVLPWIIWSSPVLFYFYQFTIRVSPGVLGDYIMADLQLTGAAMGALASWYYIGYTCMQIPVGLLIDRIGVRLPLFMATLLCVGGCYLFSMDRDVLVIALGGFELMSLTNLEFMSLGRLMMGVGSALGFLSCVKTASLWFSPQKLGLLIGLTLTIGTMGATFGGAPLSLLAEQMGWRATVQGMGLIGLGLALYAIFVIKDSASSPYHTAEPEVKGAWYKHVFISLSDVFFNKYTWIFGLYGGMMYVHLSGFADMWGPRYVSQTCCQDKSISAAAVSMIYFGVAAGAPLAAILADYWQSYIKVMLLGAAGAFVLFFVHLYAVEIPFGYLYPLYLVIGLFSGAQFLCFAAVCSGNDHSKTGAASGVHNMMCMASGIIFQPLIGYLLDWNWDGTLEGQSPLYAKSDYNLAMIVIPASLAIAAISCLFMKETYKKKEVY